jgi:hypothetical protein
MFWINNFKIKKITQVNPLLKLSPIIAYCSSILKRKYRSCVKKVKMPKTLSVNGGYGTVFKIILVLQSVKGA